MPNPDFEFPVHGMVGGATGLVGGAVGAAVVSAFQGMQNRRNAARAAGHEAMLDCVVDEWQESYQGLEQHAEATIAHKDRQLADKDQQIADRDLRIIELEAALADRDDKLWSISVIQAQKRKARAR